MAADDTSTDGVERDLAPFAANIQGVAVGAMLGGTIAATWGWEAVALMAVPATVLMFVGFVIEKRSDTASTGLEQSE